MKLLPGLQRLGSWRGIEVAAGLGTEFLSIQEQFRTDQCRKSGLVGELHKRSALWPVVFASANKTSTHHPLVAVGPGLSVIRVKVAPCVLALLDGNRPQHVG